MIDKINAYKIYDSRFDTVNCDAETIPWWTRDIPMCFVDSFGFDNVEMCSIVGFGTSFSPMDDDRGICPVIEI